MQTLQAPEINQSSDTNGKMHSALTRGDIVASSRFVQTAPVREVRFAVTMVGGTSLAIYECGAAAELFNMINGAGAYGLLKCLTNSHAFVDILSGTSAGGINTITLAAAIANGTDFAAAESIWIKQAGIDDLLQRPEERIATTLFRGDSYYYPAICECFKSLLTRTAPVDRPYPSGFPGDTDRGYGLDLFVTGTRFEGINRSYSDIFGEQVNTTDYRGVFHLKHAPRKSGSDLIPELPDQLGGWDGSDEPSETRTDRLIIRLARIARTTSCLPAIFEPSLVTPERVGSVIEFGGDAAAPETQKDWFFDGGFLNNRPIDLVLKEVFKRTSTVEVSRKVLFVEPVAVDKEKYKQMALGPNALESILFYITVPGNQSISTALDDLTDFNKSLIKSKKQLLEIRQLRIPQGIPSAVVTSADIMLYKTVCSDDLNDDALQSYLCSRAAENGNPQAQVNMIARDGANNGEPLPDIPDYRTLTRLINLVRTEVRDLRFPLTDDLQPHNAARSKRMLDAAAENTVRDTLSLLSKLRDEVEAQNVKTLAVFKQMGAASKDTDALLASDIIAVWKQQTSNIASFADRLKRVAGDLANVLSHMDTEPTSHYAWALNVYRTPDMDEQQKRDALFASLLALDQILYPYSRLANVKGESRVDLVYISARSKQDCLSNKSAEDKLAGDVFYNLGGFLKRSWRVNDILWGRLDTADALISTLLEPTRLEWLQLRDPNYVSNVVDAVVSFVNFDDIGRAINGLSDTTPPSFALRNILLGQWGKSEDWEIDFRNAAAAASPAALAELIKTPILLRQQLAIVNELVPEVFASEIAEWAEQSAQNLTPEQAVNSNLKNSAVNDLVCELYPISSPGMGAVVEQLASSALVDTQLSMPGTDPAKKFVTGGYKVGEECVAQDIPGLVTAQRAAQSALVALQVFGQLAPPKIDVLLFKLPRSIAWVIYGMFLALRQGSSGRIAALTVTTLVLAAIPLLLAFDLVSSGAFWLFVAIWLLALSIGGYFANMRSGPCAATAWIAGGISSFLFGVFLYTAMSHYAGRAIVDIFLLILFSGFVCICALGNRLQKLTTARAGSYITAAESQKITAQAGRLEVFDYVPFIIVLSLVLCGYPNFLNWPEWLRFSTVGVLPISLGSALESLALVSVLVSLVFLLRGLFLLNKDSKLLLHAVLQNKDVPAGTPPINLISVRNAVRKWIENDRNASLAYGTTLVLVNLFLSKLTADTALSNAASPPSQQLMMLVTAMGLVGAFTGLVGAGCQFCGSLCLTSAIDQCRQGQGGVLIDRIALGALPYAKKTCRKKEIFFVTISVDLAIVNAILWMIFR